MATTSLDSCVLANVIEVSANMTQPRKINLLCFALVFFKSVLLAQNPHGELMKIDCAACHSPDAWTIPASAWRAGDLIVPERKSAAPAFRHSDTGFALTGQHAFLDCRDCHASLVFDEAQSACISCHTDVHQNTVGADCMRCHTTDNWLVDDVSWLHEQEGFPLLGQHAVVSCNACHTSETNLRFDRIGNDCINCHLTDFEQTKAPDHRAAGYSTDCTQCHDPASPSWFWTSGFNNHQFFPLTGGHAIQDCNACHAGGVFQGTPTDCFACHEDDFRNTTSPNHVAGGFPTDCTVCHTIEPGWPANDFTQHDQLYFPIFSGKHKGKWADCTECHTTPGNFKAFSCIDCHEHNDPNKLAKKHDDVPGYQFNSQACYQCHPNGDE